MSCANFGEPVMLVRSPTMMNWEPCSERVMPSEVEAPPSLRRGSLDSLRSLGMTPARTTSGSNPLNRKCCSTGCGTRGGRSFTASAIARMCSGVVPQQPPTKLIQLFCAYSRSRSDIIRGV